MSSIWTTVYVDDCLIWCRLSITVCFLIAIKHGNTKDKCWPSNASTCVWQADRAIYQLHETDEFLVHGRQELTTAFNLDSNNVLVNINFFMTPSSYQLFRKWVSVMGVANSFLIRVIGGDKAYLSDKESLAFYHWLLLHPWVAPSADIRRGGEWPRTSVNFSFVESLFWSFCVQVSTKFVRRRAAAAERSCARLNTGGWLLIEANFTTPAMDPLILDACPLPLSRFDLMALQCCRRLGCESLGQSVVAPFARIAT